MFTKIIKNANIFVFGVYKIMNIYFANSHTIAYTPIRNMPCKMTAHNPSFGKSGSGNSFEDFKIWANDTDFYSNALNIIDYTGTVLGSGFEGITYSIPDNDKWVIKVDKRASFLPVKTDKPTAYEIKDNAPSLNLGQMIGYVIIPSSSRTSRKFYIMKKQKGDTFGIPFQYRNNFSDLNTKLHIKSLKNISEFPPKSYEQLVKDVVLANKCGYKFDLVNPNNIMIDNENKKINFVDVEYNEMYKNKNQLFDVLFLLLDGEFAVNFNNSNMSDQKIREAARYSDIIISKFKNAVRQCGFEFKETENLKKILTSLKK